MVLVALVLVVAFAQQPKLLEADVAYVSKGDVWAASSDGAVRRRLTFDGRNESPSISRDGRRVAYLKIVKVVDDNRGGQLCVCDLATGRARRVFGSTALFAWMVQGYDNPKTPWSPEGNWIVCSSTNLRSLGHAHHDSPCTGDVWLADPNGGPARHVVVGDADVGRGRSPGFVWSPSGREILWWNTDRIGDYFHVVDLAGHDRRLKFAEVFAGPSVGQLSPIAAWKSANRLVIALHTSWEEANLCEIDASGKRLWRSRNVDEVCAIDRSQFLAVCQTRSGDDRTETWLTDVRGAPLVCLESRRNGGMGTQARFSPDKSQLVLFADDRPVELFGGGGVHEYRLFGVPQNGGIDSVAWSHDSRSLWIVASGKTDDRGVGSELYVVNAKSGKVTLVDSTVSREGMFVRE